jgi:hypothetical protein
MPKPVINQALVDRIIERAKESSFGLQETPTGSQLDLHKQFAEPHTTETLALLLVGAFHLKYDLISVFAAAMEELTQPHA